MAKASASIPEQLAKAAANRALVQVDRSMKRADRLEGFLIALGSKWALLHLVNNDYWVLNGYAAIRREDVRRVRSWDGKRNFPARALAYFKQKPQPVPDLDLTSTASVLRSAERTFPLVTIHTEAVDPTVCYIGKPTGVSDRTLHLLEIDPGAVWREKPTKWKLRDVTRIELGGRYEQALLALGGEPDSPG